MLKNPFFLRCFLFFLEPYREDNGGAVARHKRNCAQRASQPHRHHVLLFKLRERIQHESCVKAEYLQKDENGNYSEWGCYYAHCDNRLSSRSKLDRNTVIFGHSASNCDPDGPKLTKLHRYMDADYVKENPYVYLSVKGEDMVFQITACFITDIDFDYIAPNPTGEELTNFFEQVAKKNCLEFDGVTFGEEDTVLTLSTCCRKYDEYNTGNQRLVLMAKLLPEGAVAQDFTVRLAPEPEMP